MSTGGFMSNDLKPNYYSIIPAKVRYDNDLTPNAKLLYSEITALCNNLGYCWASNSYFSELYGVSDRTIQRILNQLENKKYINIKINDFNKRLIYIDFTTHDKNVIPPTTKMSHPHDKNVTHNTKSNIISEYNDEKEFFDYDWLNDF